MRHPHPAGFGIESLIFRAARVHYWVVVKSLTVWAAALALAGCLCAQSPNAPNYTAAGLVNGASFAPGLAPGTIVSLFGTNLSWDTCILTSSDLTGGVMPTTLCNVEVYFQSWPAFLYYVSPTQINLMIPNSLVPGRFNFWVARQGTAGPVIQVTLQSAAPAMFQMSATEVVATHVDGSVVTNTAPATAGEVITLWATGLGNTNPAIEDGILPAAAAWISQLDQFNGTALDPSAILYAGVAPGYAGLYQVNVRLPDTLPPNPQIRMTLAGTMSPAGAVLPAE